MVSKHPVPIATFVLLLLFPATTNAQTTGTVIGSVKDAQGRNVPYLSRAQTRAAASHAA